ncbi:Transcription elongation factor SPT5 [Holothuria leucospilota]|uniref:Transcription elongation factor SPT5 n=1 Tax=Holothuria leucospilota TaxID=206669 RepID=A0A9Q1C0J4_HOLLE|nr:Transcription elongation factor SPT5 [Holothuria leucospilota]
MKIFVCVILLLAAVHGAEALQCYHILEYECTAYDYSLLSTCRDVEAENTRFIETCPYSADSCYYSTFYVNEPGQYKLRTIIGGCEYGVINGCYTRSQVATIDPAIEYTLDNIEDDYGVSIQGFQACFCTTDLCNTGLSNQRGVTPQQGGVTSEQRGVTPKQGGVTPKQGGVTPMQGGVTPMQGGVTPKQGGVTPKQGGVTPKQGGVTPKQGGVTPMQGVVTPKQGGVTPKQGGVTPKQRGVASQKGGVTPPRSNSSLLVQTSYMIVGLLALTALLPVIDFAFM